MRCHTTLRLRPDSSSGKQLAVLRASHLQPVADGREDGVCSLQQCSDPAEGEQGRSQEEKEGRGTYGLARELTNFGLEQYPVIAF